MCPAAQVGAAGYRVLLLLSMDVPLENPPAAVDHVLATGMQILLGY